MSERTRRKGKAIGGDWVETKDDEGNVYYANVKTRRTTWNRPPDEELVDEDEEEQVQEEGAGGGSEKAKAKNTSKVRQTVAKPDAWLERVDNRTGNIYYYNPARGQTSLFRPDQEVVTTGVFDENAGRGAWVPRVDPKSKKTYFYNPILQKTSWTNPDEEEKLEAKKKELATKGAGTRLSMKLGEAGKAAGSSIRNSIRNSIGLLTGQGPGGGQRASARYSLAIPKLPTNRNNARASIRFGATEKLQVGEDGKVTTNFAPINDDRFAKLRAMKNRDVLLGNKTIEEDDGNNLEIDLDAMIDDLDWHFDHIPFFRYVQTAFNQRRRVDFNTIQQFTNKKLRYPLHDIGIKELNSDAKTASAAILYYQGVTKNKKPKAHWARVICELGNGSPDVFKNEIYSQLVKQTTDCPKPEWRDNCWELIALCCGTFLPDLEFSPYLKTHIKEAVENPQSEMSKRMAEYALLRMEQTKDLGDRLEIPSLIEVRAIQKREPLKIRIHLINRTAILIQADTWTTVEDLNKAIEKELGVQDGTPFTVFEFDDKEQERVLDKTDRVLDIISYWEREVQQRGKKKGYTPSYQFVYKVRLFFDIQEDDISAIELAYYQAINDVTDSRYPCSETDAVRLAALEAQEKFGDYVPNSDVFGENLALYVQEKYYDENTSNDMKERIYAEYSKLSGYTPLEAKLNYLDYVKAWKIYGSAYFVTEPQNTRHTKFPPVVIIAVNAKGVLIVDPETKDFLKEYPYSEIVTWGHSSTTFVLVVGNLIRSRKIFFATDQGLELNSLIHAYVQKLLEVQ